MDNIFENQNKIFLNKKLFNPDGDDNLSKRKMFYDSNEDNYQNSTGIFNLEKIKYMFAENFYQNQMNFLQFPREISLVDDIQHFFSLSEREKEAFMNVLSFLAFLDSVQSENLISLNLITDAYEIKRGLLEHAYIEGGIHTESYQYILKSLFGERSDLIEKIYYKFKTFEPLKERNLLISNNYQDLYDIISGKKLYTKERYYLSIFKNIIQDYILEGVIFYMGFMLFHLFYYRKNQLGGINKIISLIKRDELLHVYLFKNIIQKFKEEYSKYYKEDMIYDLFEKNVDYDIKFYSESIGDSILNLSEKEIENYIKFLANKRLKLLGLKEIYNVNYNPFEDIEKSIGYTYDITSSRKDNFFESGSIDYKHSNDINQNIIFNI